MLIEIPLNAVIMKFHFSPMAELQPLLVMVSFRAIQSLLPWRYHAKQRQAIPEYNVTRRVCGRVLPRARLSAFWICPAKRISSAYSVGTKKKT